jgi:L-ascorbate metabolism protein UlaG (beta-lactamase superfamily)
MLGIKFPRTNADIVTVSHQHKDHNAIDNIGSGAFLIDGPGEYEVKGVRIQGISTYHDNQQGKERGKNVLYLLHIDEIFILHCGDLGHKLFDEHIDLLEEVDILLVPVGGVYTIDSKTAVEVVAQIGPRIVIPMHYNEPRLNQETFGKLSGVEAFLKEMGKEGVNGQDKLTILKNQLPDEMEIVVLK